MAIQLFIPKFRVEETLDEIRVCLEKGWTGLGYKTVEFESEWKKFSGLEHAHFLDSATSGLHLAVKLLKIKNGWSDGDEIITTPLTFVSTNHAILYEKLKPVFADVDEYLCLDPKSVIERLSSRTRGVIFVGLGGNVGQIDRIVEICKQRGLSLILDAAHMTGTRRLDGSHVGHEAAVSVFSFQAVKNLPTADSGMICFNDESLDIEVRKWSWLGINKDTYSRTISNTGNYKWYYDVERVGYKYHGNSVMAAIGLVSLKYVDEDNEKRREIATWYDRFFSTIATIQPVRMSEECIPSRHLYQVIVPKRDELITYLNMNDIFPGVHYRDNTVYKMYAYGQGTCPKAHYASEHIISLPMHVNLTLEDVKCVAEKVIEFCEAN